MNDLELIAWWILADPEHLEVTTEQLDEKNEKP